MHSSSALVVCIVTGCLGTVKQALYVGKLGDNSKPGTRKTIKMF